MDEPAPSLAEPIRFLFAMFQGSGNIPPILAVAQQFVANGHQVCIIVGPGLQREHLVRSSYLFSDLLVFSMYGVPSGILVI